jgi:hypothetical protein
MKKTSLPNLSARLDLSLVSACACGGQTNVQLVKKNETTTTLPLIKSE